MARSPQMRTQISREREHADAGPRSSYQLLTETVARLPELPIDTAAMKSIAVTFAGPILAAFAIALRNADALERLNAVATTAEYIESDGTPTRPVVAPLVACAGDIRRYLLEIERDIREALFAPRVERVARDWLPGDVEDAFHLVGAPEPFNAPSIPRLAPLTAPVVVPEMPAELVAAIEAARAAREAQYAAEAAYDDIARRYREGGNVSMIVVGEAEAVAKAAKVKRLELRAAVDEPHRAWRAEVGAAITAAFDELAGELRDGGANAIVGRDMVRELHRGCQKHRVLWALGWDGAPALRAAEALIDTLMSGHSPRRHQFTRQAAAVQASQALAADGEAARRRDIRARQEAAIEAANEQAQELAEGDFKLAAGVVRVARRADLEHEDD